MLQPQRTKYRRPHKGRSKGNAQRGNQLAFGSFGIKSLDTHWLTGRVILRRKFNGAKLYTEAWDIHLMYMVGERSLRGEA